MPCLTMIKIGGSLMDYYQSGILEKLGTIITLHSTKLPIVIVPGGGPFADVVRHYGCDLKLSDQTCHFMALSAMDQYAFLLQEVIKGSELCHLAQRDFPIQRDDKACPPFILLCSQFLRQVAESDLPRSWDVTSDSIAAYLAKLLKCCRLILIKSKDIDQTLAEPDVDPFFQHLLPLNIPTWFINGLYPERLINLFETGRTKGLYLPSGANHAQIVL